MTLFSRGRILLLLTALLCAAFIYLRSTYRIAAATFLLRINWWKDADLFYISAERDGGFDVTFANYSVTQDSYAAEGYPDLVPPVLHHIALGQSPAHPGWSEARTACLDLHPGWEEHLWTDDVAGQFVQDKFPHLKEMWEGYKYPIQRIDALRYMILQEYGGAVLDMDLHCRRSLGPLRRFGFMAPAAHPVGFSNGMMMASKGHPFVQDLVANLPVYDLNWFYLPYSTVMFSTGCHYASTIHSLQPDRSGLRILSGPPTNPTLHRLNGDVVTPLFHHLGSSSWHSFDASLIVRIGRLGASSLTLCAVSVVGFAVVVVLGWAALLQLKVVGRLRRRPSRSSINKMEPKSPVEDVSFKYA